MITLIKKRPLANLEILCGSSDGGLPNYLDANDLGLIQWLSDRGINVSISAAALPQEGNLIAASEEMLARRRDF